jgi:hypothetical protein
VFAHQHYSKKKENGPMGESQVVIGFLEESISHEGTGWYTLIEPISSDVATEMEMAAKEGVETRRQHVRNVCKM